MIQIDFKALLFDRPAVLSAVDKATRRVLSRFGAFVRTTARHSIRRKKGASAPGSPPHSHEGSLRRLIYFGYDPSKRSVVVGPVPFGKGEAPALLEHGGTTTLKRRGKTLAAHYRQRSFMGPALEAEKPQLPAMWADSVKR
ncbi:MAG: hypothetical protein IT442_14920 [Phycisphaeraceae bacterium]|nr:hypothetical protein [Phycisphaeraceae bacterium]